MSQRGDDNFTARPAIAPYRVKMDEKISDIQTSYNLLDEYVRQIYDELQHKPFDRELLDRFAERVRDTGLICDVGTGPGHVARYLHDGGINICGIDLAPEMIDRHSTLESGNRVPAGKHVRIGDRARNV